jgi:hypothetical protein
MSEKLHAHEYANLFPLASSNELDEMAQDIKARGLLNPIVMLDGLILDGRNRYDACLLAGVAPRFNEYSGTDPLADVLSWNLHRRQLSTGQRAMVAAKMANLSIGDNRGAHRPKEGFANLPTLTASSVSQSEAAIKLNVSPRLVADAKTIQRESPELAAKVEAGTITVHAAKERINHTREKSVDPLSSGRETPKLDDDSDNETIMGLRRYWRKATKKEKASFLAWVNKGTKEGTKE